MTGRAIARPARLELGREMLEFREFGESTQAQMTMPTSLGEELQNVFVLSLPRLICAAILGGLIGLDREIKHRPAGLRTNMFICIGAAMFTLLSRQLAIGATEAHTYIAAQIIPGIGFIGAGSILHYRKDLVSGLTSAATLFVVASVGMAVGGGLYLTAIFATALILLSLVVMGAIEQTFSIKLQVYTYEVSGQNPEEMTIEVNTILEAIHSMAQNLQTASTRTHVRMQFDVEGTRKEQGIILHKLQQSSVLQSATPLGPVQQE